MKAFVGLDVSLKSTSICVLDAEGMIVREGSVSSDAEKIASFLVETGLTVVRVGLETGNFAQWLWAELCKAGLPAICIDAKHAHGVLTARINKTDRNDARGIAEIMRAGLYRAVHVKSKESQIIRARLTARKLLQLKSIDLENAIAGILRGFGMKVSGRNSAAKFEQGVKTWVAERPDVAAIIAPLMAARRTLRTQFAIADRAIEALARREPVCRRLMTVPGVGPIVALSYRSTIDIPERFRRSRLVGAHIGLTPRTRQSGGVESRGRISKCGDVELRRALVTAASVVIYRCKVESPLARWAKDIAARCGIMKAMIALARRLAVLLHRVWIDGGDYRPSVINA